MQQLGRSTTQFIPVASLGTEEICAVSEFSISVRPFHRLFVRKLVLAGRHDPLKEPQVLDVAL